jgi:hypothetical protein
MIRGPGGGFDEAASGRAAHAWTQAPASRATERDGAR